MRHSFQLMALAYLLPIALTSRSPFWVAESVLLSWLGCRRKLRRVYKAYEDENRKRAMMERPTFVQQCSLEDGCSIRFYGDECQHGNGRVFTRKSVASPFYDGYGGDCSFKANKKWECLLVILWDNACRSPEGSFCIGNCRGTFGIQNRQGNHVSGGYS